MRFIVSYALKNASPSPLAEGRELKLILAQFIVSFFGRPSRRGVN